MADLPGRVGDGYQAPGAQLAALRIGRNLDVITNLKGPWAELVKDGKVFSGATAVAGVAPGTSVGTTAAFAMYNPTSDTDMVLIALLMEYVSGTLGIGVVDIIGHLDPTQAAFTGTAIVGYNRLLGGSQSRGKALTTATVPSGGVQLQPFVNLPPMLATSVFAPWIQKEYVDGSIIITPGTGISLQATAAAGTSPLVRYGAIWAEVQK